MSWLDSVDDVGLGAVVALQSHHLRVGKVVLKTLEEPHVGASEAINGLVGIPDCAHVPVGWRELFDQAHLLLVNVLILINEYPGITMTVSRLQVRLRIQQVG